MSKTLSTLTIYIWQRWASNQDIHFPRDGRDLNMRLQTKHRWELQGPTIQRPKSGQVMTRDNETSVKNWRAFACHKHLLHEHGRHSNQAVTATTSSGCRKATVSEDDDSHNHGGRMPLQGPKHTKPNKLKTKNLLTHYQHPQNLEKSNQDKKHSTGGKHSTKRGEKKHQTKENRNQTYSHPPKADGTKTTTTLNLESQEHTHVAGFTKASKPTMSEPPRWNQVA